MENLKLQEVRKVNNINELVDLAKSYYTTGDIVSSDYLNWQYNSNPAGKAIATLTWDIKSEQLAGQYFLIPMNYTYNGDIYNGSLSLNTLTKPDYQGKGLFTSMAKNTYDVCRKNKIPFTVGFPNPLSFPGFIKKLDFQHLGNINLLVKPLRPTKILSAVLKKDKAKHEGEINIYFENSKINDLKVKLLTSKDKKMYTDFWEKVSSKDKIRVNKNWNYIQWRYNEIPNRKYYCIKACRKEKIVAFCVIRVKKTLGIRTGVIMDFMVLPGEKKAGISLLKYISKTLSENGVEMIAVLNPGKCLEKKILKSEWFLKVPHKLLPQKIPFIVRVNSKFPKKDSFLTLNNWIISFGDYDIH